MEVINESNNSYQLNELFVNVLSGLEPSVENSIYYTKLKHQLHPEIINFCREQLELKADLNMFRLMVGDPSTEEEIREYLDTLKAKYNNGAVENVGLDYHIEVTRFDYGVPVFVIIKRDKIYMKKFVFRFRKMQQERGIGSVSSSGIPKEGLV